MNCIAPKGSFLRKYTKEIAPVLQEIDVMMKTYERPLTISQAAEALKIKKKEVRAIMDQFGLKKINKKAFFCIMRNGSSSVCRLYQRELAAGLPFTYSKETISFIYEIDKNAVSTACDQLGIKEATCLTLPRLFSLIPT